MGGTIQPASGGPEVATTGRFLAPTHCFNHKGVSVNGGSGGGGGRVRDPGMMWSDEDLSRTFNTLWDHFQTSEW